MHKLCDYLIVGAGLTGAVIARILSDYGCSVVVIEQNVQPAARIICKPASDLLHTTSESVWRFVNRFAQWDNEQQQDSEQQYFQGVPKHGYKAFMEALLADIETITQCVYHPTTCDITPRFKTIYTGKIDRLFDYIFGPLHESEGSVLGEQYRRLAEGLPALFVCDYRKASSGQSFDQEIQQAMLLAEQILAQHFLMPLKETARHACDLAQQFQMICARVHTERHRHP
jgi:hypothetical protein